MTGAGRSCSGKLRGALEATFAVFIRTCIPLLAVGLIGRDEAGFVFL